MRLFRSQSFQRPKAAAKAGDLRSPIVDVEVEALRRIQKGTMHFSWKGVMCNKDPFDVALYSLLLWQLQPKTIIEIGYKFGGSALWFVDQTRAMGLSTRLVCVDVEQREQISDPAVTFLHGDGRNLGPTLTDALLASLPHPWLIVEDADHHYLTTKRVLEFFAPHMAEGDYMAVEDGVCDTFKNEGRYDGGPNLAVQDFESETPGIYELDAELCDFFGHNVTWCTNGWLRRSAVSYQPSGDNGSAE